MKQLYIDTSSSFLYTAILEDDRILSHIEKDLAQDLSKEALPLIVSMFEENNIEAKEISKIYVVNGPGSFTGIRIGVTIAKTYAWTRNIPIVPLLSLEAMAISSKEESIHVPIIDARRGYVFGAIYNEKYEPLLKPQHVKLEELKKVLTKYENFEWITNDDITSIEETKKYTPDYLKIIEVLKNREEINPHALNPEYLKLTEAEESKL